MSGDPGRLMQNLLEQGMACFHHGRLQDAKTAFARALKIQPDQPDAMHMLGLAEYQLGDLQAAISWLQKLLRINPNQAMVCNNLANLFSAAGRFEEAVEMYQRATLLNPQYLDAHRNLAGVQLQLGHDDKAMESFSRALSLNPRDGSAHAGIALLWERSGQLESAAESYQRAIDCQPDNLVAYGKLGKIQRRLGRIQEACKTYEAWLKLEPANATARHLLAACQSKSVPERASEDYVKETFDRFANSFDASLSKLNYCVPELISEAVEEFLDPSEVGRLSIADLGCGTGLCGPKLRRWPSRLVGVDVSPQMLAKAEQRGVFDRLHDAELTSFLQGQSESFDLLIAADTFVYIGQLEPVFAAAQLALKKRGKLIFTLERDTTKANGVMYRLQPTGRFAHRRATVEGWLKNSGLKLRTCRHASLREEEGEAVHGFVIVAEKP